jgi:hypothetical protein
MMHLSSSRPSRRPAAWRRPALTALALLLTLPGGLLRPLGAHAQTYIVSTLAGTGTRGEADGSGASASFNGPTGVAVDGAGNMYVADQGSNKIRKLTPGGVVSTLAGSGTRGAADGPGSGASFNYPTGVAVDGAGNVYVADQGNNKIRKVTPGGVVSTLAGSGTQGTADGPGSGASFNGPTGVAMDGAGNVYVADYNNKIRKITPAGMVSTLAGSGVAGAADGPGASASFLNPTGVVVDGAGNVYVADQGNNKIRKVTPGGVVSTLAGSGTRGAADGPGAGASFNYPTGVAVDGAGNVYVADNSNQKIRKVTPGGVVSTLAGTGMVGATDGPGASASFYNPSGMAVDGASSVYVADYLNNKIRKLTPANGLASTPALTAAQVGLFPNPTGKVASVRVTLPVAVGTRAARATVLNALGQVLSQTTLAVQGGQASGTIRTQGLAAGMYVVRLQAGDAVLSKRLVVE